MNCVPVQGAGGSIMRATSTFETTTDPTSVSDAFVAPTAAAATPAWAMRMMATSTLTDLKYACCTHLSGADSQTRVSETTIAPTRDTDPSIASAAMDARTLCLSPNIIMSQSAVAASGPSRVPLPTRIAPTPVTAPRIRNTATRTVEPKIAAGSAAAAHATLADEISFALASMALSAETAPSKRAMSTVQLLHCFAASSTPRLLETAKRCDPAPPPASVALKDTTAPITSPVAN